MNIIATKHAAIELAEQDASVILHKYADPTEGARDGISIAEARAIAVEDPSLIYATRRPTAAAALGSIRTEKKAAAARENGKKGGRPSRPMFEVSVLTNEGEKFVSIKHLTSGCGADFYESGEELEWQDNNGLFSNCSPSIIQRARNAAKKALA